MFKMQIINGAWAVVWEQKGIVRFTRWSTQFTKDKAQVSRANEILEAQVAKCQRIEAGRRALRLVGKLKNPESRSKWTRHTIIQFNKLGRAA